MATTIEYTKYTAEEVTRNVETMDDLLAVLHETGYGTQLTFEMERDGRWYRVKVTMDGETTGLRRNRDRAA